MTESAAIVTEPDAIQREAEARLALRLWARHRPGLEAALAAGGDTREFLDVLQAVHDQTAQVWANDDAMVVTEVFPDIRTATIWLATGSLEAIRKIYHSGIEPWARELDLQRVTVTGRKGWARELIQDGFTTAAVVMTKEIG